MFPRPGRSWVVFLGRRGASSGGRWRSRGRGGRWSARGAGGAGRLPRRRPWWSRRQPADLPPVGGFGLDVLGCRSLCRQGEVPADHADHQHRRGREEHQREALDQRIAAVDQNVLDAGDRAAVEDEVRGRDDDEEDQRRLDHGGEDARLPNREHGQQAARDVADREDDGEFLVARARVVGEADGRGRRGQHDGPPPGDTGDSRQRGAVIGRNCRPCTLS